MKWPSRRSAVGLGDDVAVLLVSGQVVDLVGDRAGLHLAVRRLDEAERVDPGVGGQRTDQADVRAFRGLDGAHPAVVRRVDVADLEGGAVTGQTTRPERGQAALVGQTGQRVGLVHELRQLAGAEELLDGGDDGPDVDQGLRRDGLDVLGRHPLANDALHAGQADPDLVLDQLAHGAQATVAEVVDVVRLDRHEPPGWSTTPGPRAGAAGTRRSRRRRPRSACQRRSASSGRASCSACTGRPWRGRSACP